MNPKDKIGRTKPSVSFVPTQPLRDLMEVMRHGAEKYGRFNWRSATVNHSVYTDAAVRHLFALMEGEDTDPGSGLPHEAHIMAGMTILLDAKQTGNLHDDRTESPEEDPEDPAGVWMKEYEERFVTRTGPSTFVWGDK